MAPASDGREMPKSDVHYLNTSARYAAGMNAQALSDHIGRQLEIPPGTVADRGKALRAADMLTVGVQGPGRGADMTARDAVNLVLANVLDHRRGDDVAAKVQHLRATPILAPMFTEAGRAIGDGRRIARFAGVLGFTLAETLGDALDALVRDMQTGAFAKWAGDELYHLTLELVSDGYAQIYLDRAHRNEAIIYRYDYAPTRNGHEPAMLRTTRVNGWLLEKIAALLNT
jgi:hypothetical protein